MTAATARRPVHRQELTRRITRQSRHPWEAPLPRASGRAFEALASLTARHFSGAGQAGRLVLDSGCGTGESTLALAARHPDALVVGADRSAARLGRCPVRQWPENAVVLRIDAGQLWRLAAAAGWRCRAHYLLYPSPWPKPRQLPRRWYAHPAWPELLRLGGLLVARSNVPGYLEGLALRLDAEGLRSELLPLPPDGPALTPFERKYRARGEALFELTAVLGSRRETAQAASR